MIRTNMKDDGTYLTREEMLIIADGLHRLWTAYTKVGLHVGAQDAFNLALWYENQSERLKKS